MLKNAPVIVNLELLDFETGNMKYYFVLLHLYVIIYIVLQSLCR